MGFRTQIIGTFSRLGVDDLFIVYVTDTNSPIANGIVITSLEAGIASNAATQITELLSSPKVKNIGVAGATSGMNSATLKRGLKDFSGSSHATVYIVADEDQLAPLQNLKALQ